ncbi:MAG: NAD(P)-dependent oxidoreductase [Betaproteobacteria bacterium]|nr:MAG: NAD(P)-dependent oxidoreductase [Betaproteobacteria bacterium]
MTAAKVVKLGWIGAGRMGFEMARRLAKAGCDLTVWNRTRAKAEPLAKDGAKIADDLPELAGCDIVFCMVSTYDDVKEVIAGPKGLLSGSARPKMVVECSSISLEGSAELRKILSTKGVELLSAPVSGNAKVIKAGKLTFVVSGPKGAYDTAAPYLDMMGQGSSYVGEGELSRIVKICHNVMLRYKAPAFVNLDFHVTFTPYLLRKDMDLGLEAGRRFDVPMPLASMTRDLVQSMMGAGMTEEDFSILLLQQAKASGIELKPENKAVGDGLSQ